MSMFFHRIKLLQKLNVIFGGCVVVLYSMTKLPKLTLFFSKSTLVIRDYELLAIDVPKIGNPTSHTGDPEPFRGVAGAKRKLNQMTPSNVYSTATPKKMARMDEAGGPVLPINGISPYMSGRSVFLKYNYLYIHYILCFSDGESAVLSVTRKSFDKLMQRKVP